MAWDQAFEVVRICAPVFALVALGWWLRRRNVIDAPGAVTINRLAYAYGLPALLVLVIARQDLSRLFEPAVILPSLAATIIGCVVMVPWAKRCRVEDRGVVLWMPFWANVSFLGFPLASNAFGDAGLTYAAILNAFTMPVFVATGIVLLSASGGEDKVGLKTRLMTVVTNPVIVAVGVGIALAALGEWPWLVGISTGPVLGPVVAVATAVVSTISDMGLPLALLAVGSALHLESLRGAMATLTVGSVAKLVLTPGITLALAHWWFPEADPAAIGTAVILMATPCAVAASAISSGMQRGAELAASHLVVSTLLSVISLPIWVAIVV